MLDKLDAALRQAKTVTEQEKTLIRESFPKLDKSAQENVLAMLLNEETILMEAAKRLTE